jgi:hypothetical protein
MKRSWHLNENGAGISSVHATGGGRKPEPERRQRRRPVLASVRVAQHLSPRWNRLGQRVQDRGEISEAIGDQSGGPFQNR